MSLPSLPAEGEMDWFAKRQAFDNAVADLLGASVQRVVVTTGNEPRPDVTFVIWTGGSSAPVNMAENDIWFSPGQVAQTPPIITTTALNNFVVGTAFTQALSASGTSPITWSVSSGSLPSGVSLSSSGNLTGTPTSAGSGSVTVQASNAAGQTTRALSWTVAASGVAPNITTTSMAAMTVGVAISRPITATGSTPITYGLTGNPPSGISINTSTGALSGTPTTAGNYTFQIVATNAFGSDSQSYTVAVAEAPVVVPEGNQSFYGNAVPGAAVGLVPGAYDDASNLWIANTYYATVSGAPNGFDVYGVRVWNPEGAPAAFLNLEITVAAILNDYVTTGALNYNVAVAPDFATPAASKVHTAPRVAGTWTEVLFDSPVHVFPAQLTGQGSDVVHAGVKFGTGTYYTYLSGTGPSAFENEQFPNTPGVYLAEGGTPRGVNSLVSNWALNRGYPLDVLIRKTA